MIETKVRVLRAENGMAWVESTEQNGCGACQAKSACAISGLGKFFSNRRRPIPLRADAARPGEQYIVAMNESDFLKAGLLAYLIPSLFGVLGAALAASLGDLWAVLGMASGFLLGLLLAGRWSGHLSGQLAPTLSPQARHETISLNQGETP